MPEAIEMDGPAVADLKYLDQFEEANEIEFNDWFKDDLPFDLPLVDKPVHIDIQDALLAIVEQDAENARAEAEKTNPRPPRPKRDKPPAPRNSAPRTRKLPSTKSTPARVEPRKSKTTPRSKKDTNEHADTSKKKSSIPKPKIVKENSEISLEEFLSSDKLIYPPKNMEALMNSEESKRLWTDVMTELILAYPDLSPSLTVSRQKKYLIDLNIMERKALEGSYNTTKFFCDAMKVIEVFEDEFPEQCRAFVKTVRGVLASIIHCPFCTINFYHGRKHNEIGNAWFLKLCSPKTPHRVVWTKFPSFPIWPAKIYAYDETTEKFFVKFFDSGISFANIAAKDCFYLTEAYIGKMSKNDKGLRKALKDVNVHVECLKAVFPETFSFAKEKKTCDPKDLFMCLSEDSATKAEDEITQVEIPDSQLTEEYAETEQEMTESPVQPAFSETDLDPTDNSYSSEELCQLFNSRVMVVIDAAESQIALNKLQSQKLSCDKIEAKSIPSSVKLFLDSKRKSPRTIQRSEVLIDTIGARKKPSRVK